MTISNELMLAILAMDSYNRGYGEGLKIEAGGASTTQIGNVTISDASNTAADSPEVLAGFFAQSYTWNGQRIISNRGTDGNFSLPWGDNIGSDPWNGYGTAAGAPFNAQALMAADFFQTVTQTTNL
jgi:hypothetical protein